MFNGTIDVLDDTTFVTFVYLGAKIVKGIINFTILILQPETFGQSNTTWTPVSQSIGF